MACLLSKEVTVIVASCLDFDGVRGFSDKNTVMGVTFKFFNRTSPFNEVSILDPHTNQLIFLPSNCFRLLV
jgi:hypothetical protein